MPPAIFIKNSPAAVPAFLLKAGTAIVFVNFQWMVSLI
jgi:hypothetical protein